MKTSPTVLCITAVIMFACTIHHRGLLAEEGEPMAKVTGIGGVFFLSRGEGEELAAWYEKHLGFEKEYWGGYLLKWEQDAAEDGGLIVWHAADSDSEWFSPSESKFMINYRVDDLEKMIEQLTAAGVEILQGPEYHENGIFAWIMDPDGNKIELWQAMAWDEKNKREK